MELGSLFRKHALHNAVKFSGKASSGAVIGKALQEEPSLKERIAEVKVVAARIIDEVNKMAFQDQLAELEIVAPELLEKKEHKEKDLFAFLGIKEGDVVVSAFPPEPSKYPHIGHAKAIILNHELARRHKGRFVLRFDDTNPNLAKKEFYDIHLDNYKWLGLSWDQLDYGSDHMDTYGRHCETLLEKGDAYVCTCSQEDVKNSRMSSAACKCRLRSREANMQLWKDMPNLAEGSCIVRLKIDLEHQNSAMRDPTIFRIIDEPHPRIKKCRVWPTYDFETTIMDCIGKITHRLRSKEFELRNELQRHIQNLLGYPETIIYEFARFNLEGVQSSGRIIRELIAKGDLLGWDDPSLTTIVSLRRRGFLAEAIKGFVLSTGITKSEATLTWDDLYVHNRRLLDKLCDRYFFVHEPVEILVENAPEQELHLKKHPEIAEKGLRRLKAKDRFYIAKKDFLELQDGQLYRLMDCLNFRKQKDKFVFDSLGYQNYKDKGKKIMHYLPVDSLVHAEILMPDKTRLTGYAEPEVKKLQPGSQIQFERFGFVRLDSIDAGVFKFWFTHP